MNQTTHPLFAPRRAARKILLLAASLVLAGCAQQLGGTNGDPTSRPRAAASTAAVEPATKETVPGIAADGPPKAAAAPPPAAEKAPVRALTRTITVGPQGDVRTIAEAARRARDGDIVEVRAGEYAGDVAAWPQRRLTIRAVGGRAVLKAAGKSAEGKGIWVIRNGHFEIEGFDFVGARVSDRNGAGIRFEHGTLIVRDSRFLDNDNGILTSNDGKATLIVEGSLFSGNGHGDGRSHGIYAGRIERVEVRGSWFRNGRVGHLLKTRARENIVEYNRLTDEEGDSSYELEFANGGRALVVGNLIEQSPRTDNPVIVSYGAEGYKWPVNELVMSHNTVVNRLSEGGTFVRVREGAVETVLVGNVWAGSGKFELGAQVRDDGNLQVPLGALPRLAAGIYALAPSAARRFEVPPSDKRWLPTAQYAHERRIVPLKAGPLLPGAVQP